MFYLKLFINAFFEKKVNAIIYLFSLFFLSVVFLYQSEIASFTSKSFSVKKEKLSFKVAYRENQMMSGFKEKIIKIPGVSNITSVDQESINKNIEKVLGKYDIEKSSLELEKFQGINIILHQDLSLKNQEMVRTYVSKLLANTNSFIAPLTLPNQELLKQTGQFKGLNSQMLKVFMFLASLCFLISFYFMLMNVFKKSFIVESYQRKEHVALKSVAIGHSPLILLVLWGIYSTKIQESLVLLFMILVIGSGLTILTKIQRISGIKSL